MASCAETARPFLLWGSAQPPNQSHVLKAGPLSFVFEPDTAFLRCVSYRGHELLRGVYAAVRGAGWVTITPHVSDVIVQRDHGITTLSFHAVCKAPSVWFDWDGVVRASRDGTIAFSFDGIARSSFLRNRIGFCVLHPDSCAGQPCTIEHVDGAVTHGVFPHLISPHQPFFNIRAISYTHPAGIELRVVCEGDVFEMEDQRNWTDASFKTYCTPLDLPTPVEIAEGTRIRQAVTITVRMPRGAARYARSAAKRVHCDVLTQTVPPPVIGFGVPWGGITLDELTRTRLHALEPSHLRCELHLGHAHWRAEFHHAVRIAHALETALELALVLPDDPSMPLMDFAGTCAEASPHIARCFVLHEGRSGPSADTFARAARLLQSCIPTHLIGTGTNRYFTELNRSRPPLDGAACIAYSCNPQVHTFDNASIVETFAGQAWTVRSARAFCGNLPLHISPLTLKPRPAPDVAATSASPPAWADPRQASLFGLGFALGSIAHLAEAGAAGITLFDLCGWNGVMDDAQRGWLQHLCGQPGVYPVYHLLADIADCAGYAWHPVAVGDQLRVAALAFVRGMHTVILISNLTASALPALITCHRSTARMRVLDETTLDTALFDPDIFRASFHPQKVRHTGLLAVPLRANAYARLDIF